MHNDSCTPANDFSVLMAVYAGDDSYLLGIAIDSIYANTLLPAKTFLVVDGPVPILLDQVIQQSVEKYSLEVIRLPENRGLAYALNAGLRFIKTTWVARADPDDLNLPTRFKTQMAILEEGYDIIGSQIIEVDVTGREIAMKKTPTSSEQIISFMKLRNPFNHMTVFFRRSFVLDVGGYPGIYLKEDYGLWALMISRGARVANSPDILVRVTAGIGMYARRGGVKYIKSEFKLQRFLANMGCKSVLRALFDGVLRSFIFSLPTSFRGKFYELFLRSRS